MDIYEDDLNVENNSENELAHYGMPRRSGRYPWGSGEEPYQHSRDFVGRYNEYEAQGMSEEEIRNAMGMSTYQFRAMMSIANNERRMYDIARAESLLADGLNKSQIAREMGLPSESSVRSLLDEGAKERTAKAMKYADMLKAKIDADPNTFLEVGSGVERDLDISPEKLKVTQEILKAQGYNVYPLRVPQVNNPGQWTTVKVLCPPGAEYKDAYKAIDEGRVKPVTDYEAIPNTSGKEPAKETFKYPASMDSNRVKIRYKDEAGPDGYTGIERDGLIEIRPGVEDLNLGNSSYAQVRILVDGTHYMKGMAVYSDNIPEGYDIVFNTNKGSNKSKMEVLKPISDDPDNPFGSLIKEHGQSTYIDSKTGEEKLSLINKRAEEGDWGEWADTLPSQFLAKQNKSLIEKQIKISLLDKQAEFEEINSLTNPTLKKQLLNSFAEDCDAAAVYLKAAALPRQKYQVIIPIASLKDNECYAPNYKDGEMVSLIRYPHGGTFEIPQLRVNNSNREGKKYLGTNPLDAIGINSKVAERLSGADFDGDTVMVIPTNSKVKITSTPALAGLKGFDSKSYIYDKVDTDAEGNKHYYRNGREFKIMNNTQTEMGKVSNLITDMTIKGASTDELARAVRHSMVVIDAEKHKLDYRQSEIDNNIQGLKDLYQAKENGRSGGAATLLSRAKSEEHIPKTQGQPKINLKGKDWYDPNLEEGALIYKTAPDKDLYYTKYTKKKNGEVVAKTEMRTTTTTKMAQAKDAYELSSGYLKENIYADYANSLKSLANKARVAMAKTGKIAYSKNAKEKYRDEVDDLMRQLDIAEKNRPRERMAQIWANSVFKAKKQDNPAMDKETERKVKQQALTSARIKFGARKEKIHVSDRQWDAIQSGAISENILKKILLDMDTDELRKMATPRASSTLSSTKIAQIKAKANSGYTTTEIADALGISEAAVRKYVKGEK